MQSIAFGIKQLDGLDNIHERSFFARQPAFSRFLLNPVDQQCNLVIPVYGFLFKSHSATELKLIDHRVKTQSQREYDTGKMGRGDDEMGFFLLKLLRLGLKRCDSSASSSVPSYRAYDVIVVKEWKTGSETPPE